MQISFSDYGSGVAVANELVNSGPDVRRRSGEALPDRHALVDFLARHDLGTGPKGPVGPAEPTAPSNPLGSPSGPRRSVGSGRADGPVGVDDRNADRSPTDGDLEQVHALRRTVADILRAGTEVEIVDGANALLDAAGAGPRLRRDSAGAGWQWYVATSPGASLADRLAVLIGVGLLGAIRSLGYERFRGCAAPDCGGVFVDVSRAGRRRFCTPELCGNRVNVAQHRARRRTDGDHASGVGDRR